MAFAVAVDAIHNLVVVAVVAVVLLPSGDCFLARAVYNDIRLKHRGAECGNFQCKRLTNSIWPGANSAADIIRNNDASHILWQAKDRSEGDACWPAHCNWSFKFDRNCGRELSYASHSTWHSWCHRRDLWDTMFQASAMIFDVSAPCFLAGAIFLWDEIWVAGRSVVCCTFNQTGIVGGDKVSCDKGISGMQFHGGTPKSSYILNCDVARTG